MVSIASDVLDIENLTFSSDEEYFYCLILLEVETDVLIGSIHTLEIITRRECLFLHVNLKMIHAKIISFYRMMKETFMIPSF